MHEIARTFLAYPSLKKWTDYEFNYRRFFEERDPLFDELTELIRRFHGQHQTVPNLQAVQTLLHGANARDLLGYVHRLQADHTLPVFPDDDDFSAQMEKLKTSLFLDDFSAPSRSFQSRLATKQGLYPDEVAAEAQTQLSEMHQALARFQQADRTVALTLFGEEARQQFQDRYQHNKDRRNNNETIYFPLPFEGYFEDVMLTAGDLVTIPGYTSQCKSVLARWVCYHLMINYQLNIMFLTTEMTADQVQSIFAVMHANNRRIFPGAPRITYKAYKTGTLTPEEEDFLFKAQEDLVMNRAYGVMQVEQPRDDFNLGDLAERCGWVENNLFPIHVCCVDYLSQINPLKHGARASNDRKTDVNKMFAEFKQFLLNYRSADNRKSPLIGITPAQISRGKYNEALKNDKLYDADAPGDFSEIERSSSVMISVLMDREMRIEGRLRLQCLKNREGEVPFDAYEVFVALAEGMGIKEFDEPDEEELTEQLMELDSMPWNSMLQPAMAG